MDPSTSTSTSSHGIELQTLNSVSRVNQENVTYMAPQIYMAAAEGDTNILERMQHSADLQVELTPKKNTVLHIAAQFGQLNCVVWIIQHCPAGSSLLQCPNLKGDSPLHLAAREGHVEVVKALIRAFAKTVSERDIESEIGPDNPMLGMTNNENDTALLEAVRYHHPEVVKLLIKEDPGLTHGPNISGGTPLYMAAERGFRDLVKIIVENTSGIQPAHTGPMRRTALHAAVVCRDSKMVKTLLKWKPNLIEEVDENGWSPLHCAAYLGYVSIARQLLDKSKTSVAYLKVENDDNKTALLIAATHGHRSVMRLLLSRYPDCCEQVDVKGNNALHLLIMQKELIYGLLKIPSLNVRALINEKNVEGQTPLHLLAHSQLRYRPSYVKSKKVDTMTLNNQNLTAMDIISSAEDLFGRKAGIVRHLKWAKARAGPLLWQKTMSKDKDNKNKDNNESKRDKGLDVSLLKKASNSHLLVATLVATVSFAAGFTPPGGYNTSDGTPILRKKLAFQAFVAFDFLALLLSVSAILSHFYAALNHKKSQLISSLRFAYWLTQLSIGAMIVAFVSSIYTIDLHPSTAIPIYIILFCVYIFIIFTMVRQIQG